MTSDFFLAQADPWREEAWDVMRQRPDVRFFLLTKRPERMAQCLPDDWGEGWENVMPNVTAENQRRADERIPILLETPAKHRGIMCAPMIGQVNIEAYLSGLEQVICGGENYDGARPCDFDWVRSLYAQCAAQDVSFTFIETGTVFIKDGKRYRMPDKKLQSRMAFKSGMHYAGKPIQWHLTDNFGQPIPASQLYEPYYGPQCQQCGSRPICNGCARCGKCEGK
jgi:protein gp37